MQLANEHAVTVLHTSVSSTLQVLHRCLLRVSLQSLPDLMEDATWRSVSMNMSQSVRYASYQLY